jgi:hypothetical protein
LSIELPMQHACMQLQTGNSSGSSRLHFRLVTAAPSIPELWRMAWSARSMRVAASWIAGPLGRISISTSRTRIYISVGFFLDTRIHSHLVLDVNGAATRGESASSSATSLPWTLRPNHQPTATRDICHIDRFLAPGRRRHRWCAHVYFQTLDSQVVTVPQSASSLRL